MIDDPSMFHLWATYAIILAGIVSYALDRASIELISLSILGTLLLFFHFFPLRTPEGDVALDMAAILSGFANPALVAIVCLLIVAQGLIQTGALEGPVGHLVRIAGNRPEIAIVISLITVTLISAFLNDTPVVVIFIPIMAALAERLHRPVSSVMMPLGFAAIFGGMLTLIGTSTNLLVDSTARSLGEPGIGFFDFTIPGLVLAGTGFMYLLVVAPRLLPKRTMVSDETGLGSGKQFITQFDVGLDSPLLGQAPIAGMFPALPNITVRAIQRGDELLVPPFDDIVLQEGDSVILAATRKVLMDLLSRNPAVITSAMHLPSIHTETGREAIPGSDRILAEAVVAPASRMEGRTIEQTGFRDQTRCIVFGIQRRSRMSRAGIDEIRLEAGDVLLVLGKHEDVLDLRQNRDVLLLEWSAQELPALTHARLAIAVFLGVVLTAASGILPITVSALIGATLMISTGCLNIRQASRSVNRRIVMIIAAALAMGTALEETGGAAYMAHLMTELFSDASKPVLLSVYFLMVALMTNVLTNNATAVLFTPIGINLGNQIGLDPTIFIYATIFAANCAFATPISYQVNLLVMGPGEYRFNDFVRVGGPLLILIWVVFSLFAPWYFGIG